MREASVLVINKNILALERESEGIFPFANAVLRKRLFQNVTDPIAAMPPKMGRPIPQLQRGVFILAPRASYRALGKGPAPSQPRGARSEERRVGKESSAR